MPLDCSLKAFARKCIENPKSLSESDKSVFETYKSLITQQYNTECNRKLYKCDLKTDCAGKTNDSLAIGLCCANHFDLHDNFCLNGNLEGRQY